MFTTMTLLFMIYMIIFGLSANRIVLAMSLELTRNLQEYDNHLVHQIVRGRDDLGKFRVIDADSLLLAHQRRRQPPHEQRLALQIMINDPSESKDKKNATSHEQTRTKHQGDELQDQQVTSNLVADKYATLEKHFYTLEPTLEVSASKQTSLDARTSLVTANKTRSTSTTTQKPTTTTPKPNRPFPLSPRSELIRTQHRPPWLWNAHQGSHNNRLIIKDSLGAKKVRLKYTTLAPMTTTEFFKLISSAHSQITDDTHRVSPQRSKLSLPVNSNQFQYAEQTGDQNEQLDRSDARLGLQERKPRTTTTTTSTTTAPTTTKSTGNTDHMSTSATEQTPTMGYYFDNREKIQTTTMASRETNSNSNLDRLMGSGHVLSPEILVQDDDPEADDLQVGDEQPMKAGMMPGRKPPKKGTGSRRPLINYTINYPKSNSKRKPVIIIRDGPHRHSTRSPTLVVIPSKITITEMPALASKLPRPSPTGPPRALPPTQAPQVQQHMTIVPQMVRLIAKQKHKYDENITSPTLTVIDNDVFRLPPNTTAVHNNRLLVRSKPGKPIPSRIQLTTEYPYYNPVAGITPPYPSNPTSRPNRLQAPVQPGSHYGLMKPGADNPTVSSTTPPSTFGAQNIKFPALASEEVPTHLEPPDKMNISVPDTANMVGPNENVPDKIVMETEGQIARPPEAIVVSDSTVVSRPNGANTINSDGIIRLSTTPRPSRFSTTKRINIVSANTTVITTNPDELHDVMSNVIMGSHQNDHISQQNRPQPRPGFLESIAKLFNLGVTTSAIALITLVKTVLVAILVMFLPPIALTAAIMQAVNIG